MQGQEVQAALSLFAALADAHSRTDHVARRSSHDKEFASEDWVRQAAQRNGLTVATHGRHAPVDLTVHAATALAVQAKGLTARNGVVRTTLDYNGTLPQPRHDGDPVLLVYTELGTTEPADATEPATEPATDPATEAVSPGPPGGTSSAANLAAVTDPLAAATTTTTTTPERVSARTRTLVVADMSLVHDEASQAQSRSIAGHGSYGDMLARLRLMYVGIQPVAFARTQGIDLTGCATLILPAGALSATDAARYQLRSCGQLRRQYATRRLVSAQVYFDGREPEPVWQQLAPRPPRRFEVWAAAHPGRPLPVPVPPAPPAPSDGQLMLDWD